MNEFSTGVIQDRFVCLVCCCIVVSARRMLPHMGAYVCFDCTRRTGQDAIAESEIANKKYSPWNVLDIIAINEYQMSDLFLPFICINEHHLIARAEGLVCPECIGFSLSWVYDWVIDGRWKNRF